MLNWTLVALGALAAALLGATLETGRLNAASNGAFRYLGALVRVITPNGDGRNDIGILCVDNPKASAVSGVVYDLRGHAVSEMLFIPETGSAIKPQCQSAYPGARQYDALTWDGRAGGRAVSAGVYLWQIQSEDATVSGTVVVAR
ncbi:MAG: hypothetical protein WC969_02590 [Elusimicrobiota bacterium]